MRSRLIPNEQRFPPNNLARLRDKLITVHVSPHGDAKDFHGEFKRLVGTICSFPGRVRLLIGSTDRWWPKHYKRDVVDQLYDAGRCPSIVNVRAQNLHAAFLRPEQAHRTGLLPIGLPPQSNWTRLQQVAAAAPPLRHRNLSMIAADWASTGSKSYPKRPIGYRTRAELRVALRASGLLAPPFERRRSQEHVWGLFASYAVVASPMGMGLDCHRTWEALALGCIVLLQDQPPARLMQRMGLPVVMVRADAWESITLAQLRRWVDEHAPRGHAPWLSRRWWLRSLRLVGSAQIPPGAGNDDSAAPSAALAGAWASWTNGAALPVNWQGPAGAHAVASEAARKAHSLQKASRKPPSPMALPRGKSKAHCFQHGHPASPPLRRVRWDPAPLEPAWWLPADSRPRDAIQSCKASQTLAKGFDCAGRTNNYLLCWARAMQLHAMEGVPTLLDDTWFSEVGRFFDWESATRSWACVVAAPDLSTAAFAQPRTLSARGSSLRARKTNAFSCQEERTCVDSRTTLLAQLLLRPSAEMRARVDDFVGAHFGEECYVGVHLRSMDNSHSCTARMGGLLGCQAIARGGSLVGRPVTTADICQMNDWYLDAALRQAGMRGCRVFLADDKMQRSRSEAIVARYNASVFSFGAPNNRTTRAFRLYMDMLILMRSCCAPPPRRR